MVANGDRLYIRRKHRLNLVSRHSQWFVGRQLEWHIHEYLADCGVNSSRVMPALRRSAATIFTIACSSFSRGAPCLVERGRPETGALAPVDQEGRSRDVARVLARQEERGAGHLLG